MARADHATEVDADLDKVDQERLLLLRLEIGAKQERRDAADAAILEPILRHVLHWLFEPEETSPDPRPLREPDILFDSGSASGRGGRGQQFALEVAAQINLLSAIAEGRTEGI